MFRTSWSGSRRGSQAVRRERGAGWTRRGKGGETVLEKSFLLPSPGPPSLLFQRRLRLSNPCSHTSPKAERPKMALLRRHPRRRDCSAWHSLPHESRLPLPIQRKAERRPRLPNGPPPPARVRKSWEGEGRGSGGGVGITFLLKSFPFPPPALLPHPCRSQAKTGKAADPCRPRRRCRRPQDAARRGAIQHRYGKTGRRADCGAPRGYGCPD